MSKAYNDISYLSDDEKLILDDLYKQLLNSERDTDIFIDIKDPYRTDTAIVVAEVLRASNSMYKNSVLGMLANRENEPAVLKCLETGLACTDFKALSQEDKVVRQSAYPIYGNHDYVVATLIEERTYAENNIINSKTPQFNLNSIATTIIGTDDNNPGLIKEACLIFNNADKLVHCNLKAREIYSKLGFQEELFNYSYNQILLSEHPKEIEGNSLNTIKISDMYLSERVVSVVNNKIGKIILIEDVTNVMEVDKELLNTKQVVREIHHRIKNNLQIISSMLRIQSKVAKYSETSKVLEESVQRIHAIAAVHDLLSVTISEQIEISMIINKLIINYQKLATYQDVKYEIFTDLIMLDSSKATTVTMVLNELITNSLEHAFSGIDTPMIKIYAIKSNELITIKVHDNGVGNGEEADHNSLGTKIINSYVTDNLQGTIEVSTNNGRCTTIKFL